MKKKNHKSTASVLVVDDEADVRQTLAGILRKGLPYAKIRLARSAKEAIKKFNAEPCDIVLLDMHLGLGDTGIDLFLKLRETNHPFRAIGVSAYGSIYQQEAEAKGIDAFISKPILSSRKKEAFINTVRLNLASLGKKDALKTSSPRAFCIMPFDENYYDRYIFGIKAAAESAGIECLRVDEEIFTSDVLEEIHQNILKADIIVADLTERNPNVYYEVGYARGKGKPVVLVAEGPENLVFDLRNIRHIFYGGKIHLLLPKLEETLRELLKILNLNL